MAGYPIIILDISIVLEREKKRARDGGMSGLALIWLILN